MSRFYSFSDRVLFSCGFCVDGDWSFSGLWFFNGPVAAKYHSWFSQSIDKTDYHGSWLQSVPRLLSSVLSSLVPVLLHYLPGNTPYPNNGQPPDRHRLELVHESDIDFDLTKFHCPYRKLKSDTDLAVLKDHRSQRFTSGFFVSPTILPIRSHSILHPPLHLDYILHLRLYLLSIVAFISFSIPSNHQVRSLGSLLPS